MPVDGPRVATGNARRTSRSTVRVRSTYRALGNTGRRLSLIAYRDDQGLLELVALIAPCVVSLPVWLNRANPAGSGRSEAGSCWLGRSGRCALGGRRSEAQSHGERTWRRSVTLVTCAAVQPASRAPEMLAGLSSSRSRSAGRARYKRGLGMIIGLRRRLPVLIGMGKVNR